MGELYAKNEQNNQLKIQPTDVVNRQKDSIFVERKDGMLSLQINFPIQFKIKDTQNNQKSLYVFLRLFKTLNGKHLLTFQAISALFGLNSRQDSNNFYREFQECDEDMLFYLKRKKKLEEALPEIEKQVLEMPLLSIAEQYKIFSGNHPEYKMSLTTFHSYYSQIDCQKIKKRYDELISKKECHPNTERLLKEVLAEDTLSSKARKEIMAVIPELEEKDKKVRDEVAFHKNFTAFGKYLLVMFLVASGLNFEVLSLLFGVSKSSIHNWFYKLSFLKRTMLKSIKWWSGIISVDEKWIKINGKWFYILSIVDNTTGFPLFFSLVSDLKADTWKIFFQRFYRLYGKPKLIISDGSKSLAKGRIEVFPSVQSQLCKFHKLKNLTRRIYQNVGSYKIRNRMLKQALRIFSNKTYYGRKRAAIALINCEYTNVSDYVRKNIPGDWKKLTKGYTSNASERWNRKIQKVTLGRYGLKSEKFVEQLITALWLKEAIRDKRHFEKCFIHCLDIKKECQELRNMCNIIDYIKHNLFKKVA